MTRLEVFPLFSKPVAVTKLDISDFEIKKILDVYNKEEFDTAIDYEDNKFSTSMTIDTQILDKLPSLKDKIFNVFNEYKNDFLKFDKNNFKISSSWFTKTTLNQDSHFHTHCNNMFSMVYYFGNNENYKSKIEFQDFSIGSNFDLEISSANLYNCKTWTFEAENNHLIIFPSETYHRIVENKTNDIRKSLALNIVPTGTYGLKDSKITHI